MMIKDGLFQIVTEGKNTTIAEYANLNHFLSFSGANFHVVTMSPTILHKEAWILIFSKVRSDDT